jgi:hypothetical protein
MSRAVTQENTVNVEKERQPVLQEDVVTAKESGFSGI